MLPEIATITRRDGKRVNSVQGFVTAGILPSKVLTEFKQQLQNSNFQLPEGYQMKFGGESAKRNEAVGDLISTVSIMLVVMVATLVLSFSSFRSAFIIVLVAICSIGLC